MRILITGVAGFIGSNLAEFLLNQDHEIWGMDNLTTGSFKNIEFLIKHPKFKFEEGDLSNWGNLKKAVLWAEQIYHLAAVVGVKQVLKEPVEVNDSNIIATDTILKIMKEGNSSAMILIASSSSVYGDSSKTRLSEEESLIIENPANLALAGYAVSKLADETIALGYQHKHGLNTLIVRFFNVIGPRQTGFYGMVVPNFVRQACLGQPLTVFGDGTQTRSFCDVRDCINMFTNLMQKKALAGQIFNVGHQDTIAILELAKLVKARAKSQSEIVFIPYKEAYGVDFHDIKQRVPELSKCLKETGYEYQWTLTQTIDDLIERFKQSVDTQKEKSTMKTM